MAPEFHAMRIVCLLKAVTPAWVTNAVPFLLVIDCNRYHGSLEVLQAEVKCQLSVEPAPALNEQCCARGAPIIVSFMLLRRVAR